MRRRHSGFVLLPVVLLLALVAVVAFMMNNESGLDSDVSASQVDATRADLVARAGLEHAEWAVQNSGCTGDLTIASTAFGNDSYQASADSAATTTTYSINVDQDAWLDEVNPGVNYGVYSALSVKNKSGASMRALYRFDVTGIPVGTRIAAATAWFYVTGNDTDGPVNIHAVTDAWTEAAANWSNTANRFDSVVVASIPAQPSSGVWVQVNLTSLVQSWVSGNPNNGIMLIATSDAKESKYTSREWPTSSERPRLEVVASSGPDSPVTFTATGTLTGNPSPANDISRTLVRTAVPVYQPPSFHLFQPDAADGKDAYIWEWEPTFNYGAADSAWVASTPPNWNRALSLFRFRVGALPAGARILSAHLSLYHRGGSDTDVPVTAHRITKGWNETFVTWNRRTNGINWDTAGGDIDTTVEATSLVGLASNMRYEWDITGLVQSWVDGVYPNYGVALRTLQPAINGELFSTSDHLDPAQHPRLSVTFACECGINCMVPQGSGELLLVVDDKANLLPAEEYREELLSDWGYDVSLVSDHEPQAQFDNAMPVNDVVYIAETVDPVALGVKLAAAPIGVINEEGLLYVNLGIANNASVTVGSAINITDTSHYISAPFAAGALDIYRAGMEQQFITTGTAPGLQTLADIGGNSALAALEQGAVVSGGGTAAGRRVMLPLGRESGFNWNYLNNNGRLVVQRAIQWGTGNTGSAPTQNLLFVVQDAAAPGPQDTVKKTLMESWGFNVSLITAADSQANFDTALASADVAYISEEITSSDLGTKLRDTSIGVINEETALTDEFGIAGVRTGYTGTDIEVVDTAHYITSVFASGPLAIASGSTALNRLIGSIAPGLDALAETTGNPELGTIETGGLLYDGGTAAGRRVQLPWGADAFDINLLNTNGQTLMRRAIEWGAGAGSTPAPVYNVLMIVGDLTLSSKDVGYKALMESWGHTVTLIDDGDSQANYDTAMAAVDVVFASGSALGASMLNKATFTTKGLVNEVSGKIDNFGFSSSNTATANTATFTATDATHYITEPFGGSAVMVFTSPLINPVPGGTLAPDLQNVGEVSGTLALGTLDTGATRYDSTPSTGRRAHLPFASAEATDLTADGETILRRTIEWAAGAGGGGGGSPPTDGVVFEEFTDAKLGGNGTSLAINKPPGTAAGDLLIAAVATDGVTDATLTPPAGWTPVDVSQQGNAATFGVWWKLAGASESASYTFTWTGDEKAYGMVMRFTGHDPVTPINVSAIAGGTSSAPAAPAVTTTVADTMILRLGGFDDDDIDVGNPGLPGHTPIVMDKSSNGNGTASAGAGYLLQAAAGDSGTADFLLSVSEEYRTVTIGIAPAP